MEEWQVITGIQLGFKKFERSEKKFKDILELVRKDGFSECLEDNTLVYTELVKQFYSNSSIDSGLLSTKVKGASLKIKASDINQCLGFPNQGLISLDEVDIEEGKRLMHYMRNVNLKDMKKKESP